MLNCVNFSSIHDRLIIGLCQAKIKGGDGFSADFVLPGDVQTWMKPDMVNGKTSDFFHGNTP
jgi:hypothetical protein